MRFVLMLVTALACAAIASPADAINAQRDNGSAGGKSAGKSGDKLDKTIRTYNRELRKNPTLEGEMGTTTPEYDPSELPSTYDATATGVPGVSIDVIRADGTVEHIQ
jgi:opacity protein-like surface antigen